MNSKFKKASAAGALGLALAGLVIGFNGAGAAMANEQVSVATGDVGDTTTSASTATLPWCGWYINGFDAAITLQGDPEYTGQAVELSGSSASDVTAFINGSSTYDSNVKNCSWYADANEQSATLTVALKEGSNTAFTAVPSNNDAADHSMDFSLTSSNKLGITATPGTDCAANGFTVIPDASIYDGHTSSTPVQSATSQADINTKNKCSWTMSYSTTIPANKTPKYGALTYTYTGPTLVTTLAVTDAVAPQ